MTEQPMDENSTTHPDEGTIHAWLDDALDAPTAAGIANHVRSCPACAERVAEARGLIAGASRIVASLDELPAGARPGWAQSAPEHAMVPATSTPRAEGSLWKWLHVTPARAAIAATILVAIGITMTRPRNGPDDLSKALKTGVLAPRTAMSDNAAAQESQATRETPDPLLDSAIKRNLAIAQPKRAMDASHTPGVPVPAPSAPAIGLSAVDSTASMRVAEGRRDVQAQRDQRTDVADKARVGRATGAVETPSPSQGAANDARSEMAAPPMARERSAAMMAPKSLIGVAIACYRMEGSAGARWAGVLFPLIVSTDSSVRAGLTAAPVLSAAGQPTSIRAQWIAGRSDSLTLRLRRVGYSGSIALGPDVGGRAGTAISAPASTELEAAGAASAPAPFAPSSAVSRVTMRPVSCPSS